ncbi:hypothetical protein [Streptomyces sp. NBC_01198]|uniref:hypothetical protein n=1 Tax=Streptomyces sp. NBC_01198 TaxID=2903769 RepID=UPI002E0D1B90|nr:hypothetical protein OG702_29145 [Streptomyces sp. NBC_01198]
MEIVDHRTTQGGDAGQWRTLAGRKTVLVLVHTEVYGRRLQDLLALLESDLRVEVVFTVAPHAFNNGAARFLARLGADVLPWAEAVRTDFDLAIAAGSQGMEKVRAPLVRISHGGGHMSLARVPSGRPCRGGPAVREPGGITGRGHLTWEGAVVPRAVALPHRDDLRALRRWCPEALPVAEVVGDPTYDRIAASLPFRAEYRAAIGVAPGQQLVLATSTWGRRSLFNHLESLLPRLAELPADRFRKALLVHPNVLSMHGRYQVRAWLADCRRAGVTVVSPDADWRALLVAADHVVGDYGSVTLYATMTGAPILLARYPYQDANPASPGVAMALTAPALSPTRPLADQLAYAAAEYPRRDFQRIARRISSEPGRFNRNMRALIYRQLGLGQPAYPPATEPVALSAGEVAL